jgi:hypothetical protein
MIFNHYIQNDISVDPAISTIQWECGTANYSIRKFSTNSKALLEYYFQAGSNVFTRPSDNDESIIDILSFETKFTDEDNIRCGYVVADFRCLFVAQYQEFVIIFSSTIEPEGMTNKTFINILMYLD